MGRASTGARPRCAGRFVEPVSATLGTTNATTMSATVAARSRRGVSHVRWRV
jgi:hypothetical protein